MTKRIGTWTQRHPSGGRSRWTQVDVEVVEDGLGRVDLSRVRPTGEESSPGGPMDLGPNPGAELEAAIRHAVGFALTHAKRERDSVELLRLRVPLEAANRASIGIAVVHAVWDAVGHSASDEQLRALEGLGAE